MPQTPAWTWDIFCRVIDNYGDVGVCWRLARELGARGQQVRLWIDDAALLPALAPGALQGRFPGVRVLPWTQPFDPRAAAILPAADVWIEAFGCTLPQALVAWRRQHAAEWGRPVWLNLEYLSAESFSRRAHGLASPMGSGPAAGWTKWFFYPGFEAGTGGLLRERELAERQAGFDPHAWLQRHVPEVDATDGWRVSLFCYEPPALPALLAQLRRAPGRCHLLVGAGRAKAAVQALDDDVGASGAAPRHRGLLTTYLPFWPQTRFDELLWACDLNFVRGEDSLVRALWAGKPFVWQPYPQHDGAHAAKLVAFLDWLQPPPMVRAWHEVWSGLSRGTLPLLAQIDWQDWTAAVRAARQRLLAQPDLVAQLLDFVAKKR